MIVFYLINFYQKDSRNFILMKIYKLNQIIHIYNLKQCHSKKSNKIFVYVKNKKPHTNALKI